MLFSPQYYQSEQSLRNASIMEANSDTIINNQEVFGYINDTAYQAISEFDPVSRQYYTIAGDIIPA
jgi:hypothetical protein